MAIIRVKHSDFELKYKIPEGADTLNMNEWEGDDTNRITESGWGSRYQYESELITSIINDKPVKTILEIGSGPGVISELIQNSVQREIEYHLIDKPYAKSAFESSKRKGTFFIKDISNGLDVSGLNSNYDMVICNDVLEHVFNPSQILQKIYNLLSSDGMFFISVPNWRMGHQFIYRGLFDYDNFIYFMKIHKFEAISVYPSPLQTPDYPKLNSEDEMEEELRRSWNWYFCFIPKK